MMKIKTTKQLLSILLVSLMTGCAVTTPVTTETAALPNETLLKATENYPGLLDLYKHQLKNAATPEESDRQRLNIASIYLSISDPESALFYLNPVIEGGYDGADAWLLASRAHLAVSQHYKARLAALRALGADSENPAIYNQIGLTYAHQGNYPLARSYFNQGRDRLLDDATAINNLALVDILEGDYQRAVNRLLPLYTAGLADDTVQANLMLALVHNGDMATFRAIHSDAKTEKESRQLFQALSTLKPISLVEVDQQ